MSDKKLTAKQKAFVQEYLIDFNSTQASIRAGYSKRTANVIGPENLAKPCISELIQKKMQERNEKVEVDAEWVLREAVSLYKKCSQQVPVLDQDGKETGEYKFDGANANRALEIVGKHVDVQAFQERIKITEEDDLVDRLIRGRERLADSGRNDSAKH